MSSLFAEDIFQLFFSLVDSGQVTVQQTDYPPVISFYTKILQKESLTKNQADYVVKILEKYQHSAMLAGLDYSASVKNFQLRSRPGASLQKS